MLNLYKCKIDFGNFQHMALAVCKERDDKVRTPPIAMPNPVRHQLHISVMNNLSITSGLILATAPEFSWLSKLQSDSLQRFQNLQNLDIVAGQTYVHMQYVFCSKDVCVI